MLKRYFIFSPATMRARAVLFTVQCNALIRTLITFALHKLEPPPLYGTKARIHLLSRDGIGGGRFISIVAVRFRRRKKLRIPLGNGGDVPREACHANKTSGFRPQHAFDIPFRIVALEGNDYLSYPLDSGKILYVTVTNIVMKMNNADPRAEVIILHISSR